MYDPYVVHCTIHIIKLFHSISKEFHSSIVLAYLFIKSIPVYLWKYGSILIAIINSHYPSISFCYLLNVSDNKKLTREPAAAPIQSREHYDIIFPPPLKFKYKKKSGQKLNHNGFLVLGSGKYALDLKSMLDYDLTSSKKSNNYRLSRASQRTGTFFLLSSAKISARRAGYLNFFSFSIHDLLIVGRARLMCRVLLRWALRIPISITLYQWRNFYSIWTN